MAEDLRPKEVKALLIAARRVRTPEEEQEFLGKLKAQGRNLAPETKRTSLEELADTSVKTGAMTPAEAIEPYYGAKLAREIIRAGNYNEAKPVIEREAYAKMFDVVKAERSPDEGAFYMEDGPLVGLKSKRSDEISAINQATYNKWLKSDDPELQARAKDYFNTNAIDPKRPAAGQKDVIEHEFGHHATKSDPESRILRTANREGYVASGEFEEFGGHTGLKDETTQALSRLQREVFKNTGSRLTNPKQFMALVEADEVPAYLSQEGQRALNYARKLRGVSMESTDKGRKKAADAALKALSEAVPALVARDKPESFADAVNRRLS